MSDPFQRLLRSTRVTSDAPVDAIKSRAARMERRRHIGLGTGGGVIAIIALVALFAGTTPEEDSQELAQSLGVSPTPELIPGTASPPSVEEETSAEERLADPVPTRARQSALRAGPDESEGAPSGAQDDTSESFASEGETLEVSLQVFDESSILTGRRVGFELRACNNNPEAVERTFTTGQRYDFEVYDDGELIWRWSDGRAFTLVYGGEVWEPGECKTYTDAWNGEDSNGTPAPSGAYQALGILTSDPPLYTDAQEFCLEVC